MQTSLKYANYSYSHFAGKSILLLPLVVFCFFAVCLFCNCSTGPYSTAKTDAKTGIIKQVTHYEESTAPDSVLTGADQIDSWIHFAKGKRIGLIVNQTSVIGNTHLLDTLISSGLDVRLVFAPEHGFRGTANAGAPIVDGLDSKTGIPVLSLYGKNKKPTKAMLDSLDLLIFDIQDVGARFYTFISTMQYAMEACAEYGVAFMVLDRPNPNGHYVDGPVLDTTSYRSFVGLNAIPVVHGMTVGELARMLVGQSTGNPLAHCDLKVIACTGWDHNKYYELPVSPSPNLPNMKSIYLYPSLCFFEGTVVSVGRGTDHPFQQIGHPDYSRGQCSFEPQPNSGAAHPKLSGRLCSGICWQDSSELVLRRSKSLNLQPLLDFYHTLPDTAGFFLPNGYFDLLAGTDHLRKQIKAGWTAAQIHSSWKDELADFMKIRSKYLLYEDFD